MFALLFLFLVFGLIVAGVIAGLFLERREDEDAARLSMHLPRQERRWSKRETKA